MRHLNKRQTHTAAGNIYIILIVFVMHMDFLLFESNRHKLQSWNNTVALHQLLLLKPFVINANPEMASAHCSKKKKNSKQFFRLWHF